MDFNDFVLFYCIPCDPVEIPPDKSLISVFIYYHKYPIFLMLFLEVASDESTARDEICMSNNENGRVVHKMGI